MPDTTTARPARRPAKRKTANRFAKLAGGDIATDDTTLSPASDAAPADDASGLIGGMTVVAAVEAAHRVVEVAVDEIAPHPFNDDARSQPQPGEPKWDELLNGVRANGVRLPVLVVPREAFTAARPSMAEQISPEARYVLVYGHRRRAAALEAGRATVPAVIDDSIMADDGDLDAMASENLGRQDLSDFAEADLYARYSEIGLSQRAIAERLGVDQATVSRRLALKLLAPEVRAAVEAGQIPSHEAPGFSGALPYGPLRRWQKKKDPEQDTQQRRDEQLEALRLVLDRGWLPSRAADRVVAEREARAEAAALGVTLVDDPEAELGADYIERRISREEFTPGTDVIGAINANTGTLDLYNRSPAIPADPTPPAGETAVPTPAADPTTAPPWDTNADDAGEYDTGEGDTGIEDEDPEAAAIAEQQRADVAASASAQARRREACAALITHQPSNPDLLKVLVRQCLSGVSARSQTSAVKALLRDWDASADGTGEKARNARAWHLAVAAAELHTAELKGAWDEDAIAHLEILVERVGYQPTEWESRQLTDARA